jgi:clan AA aspartic protease (TIGR02281 family)
MLISIIPSLAQCIKGDCENGFGIYVFSNGDKYEGDWKDGKINGHGKYMHEDGSYEEGEYVDNFSEGRGISFNSTDSIYTYGDWSKDKLIDGKIVIRKGFKPYYQGEVKDEKYEGKGVLHLDDGSRYEGEFVKGNYSGTGTYYFNNGNRFEGTFLNGKQNGDGVLYLARGGKLIGKWVDDEWVSGSNEGKSDTLQGNIIIQMEKTETGVYEIPITLNSVLNIPFVMDTGASEMFLTPDVALTLYRTGTISKNDFLEGQSFVDAQGDIQENSRFTLKEIDLGGYKVKNVPAAVGTKITAMNLLGQNVLSKLHKFTINYNDGTFTIMK